MPRRRCRGDLKLLAGDQPRRLLTRPHLARDRCDRRVGLGQYEDFRGRDLGGPRLQRARARRYTRRVSLIAALRTRLGNPNASSFQLMGEDLQLLTIEDLRSAVAAHDAALPDDLRADLLAEEAALAAESHRWLKKFNRSLYGRIEEGANTRRSASARL